MISKEDIFINDFDESTITKNLFLVGPQANTVMFGSALFTNIDNGLQLWLNELQRKKGFSKKIQEVLQDYKDNNFYLNVLSCCDNSVYVKMKKSTKNKLMFENLAEFHTTYCCLVQS